MSTIKGRNPSDSVVTVKSGPREYRCASLVPPTNPARHPPFVTVSDRCKFDALLESSHYCGIKFQVDDVRAIESVATTTNFCFCLFVVYILNVDGVAPKVKRARITMETATSFNRCTKINRSIATAIFFGASVEAIGSKWSFCT